MTRAGWVAWLMLASTAAGCKDDEARPAGRTKAADLVRVLDELDTEPRPLMLLAEAVRPACGEACACLHDAVIGHEAALVAACPSVCTDEVRRRAASAIPTERMPALVAACGLDPLGLSADTATLISTDWLVALVVGQYVADQLAGASDDDARALVAAMVKVRLPLRPSQEGLPIARKHAPLGPATTYVAIDIAGALRSGPLPVARLTDRGAVLETRGDVELPVAPVGPAARPRWRVVGNDRPLDASHPLVFAHRDAPALRVVEALAALPAGGVIAVEGVDGVAGFPRVFGGVPDPGWGTAAGGATDLIAEVTGSEVILRSSSRRAEYGRVAITGGQPDAAGFAKAVAHARKIRSSDGAELVVEVHPEVRIGLLIAVLDAVLETGASAITLIDWVEPGQQAEPDVPRLQFGVPVAVGDLDKRIIRRHVKRRELEILHCYEKQLLQVTGLRGTVTVDFFISPDGTVTTATAEGVDPDVASCVARSIEKVAFPKLAGGGVEVRYLFTFYPDGGTAIRRR